jgi:ABC-type sugar transport system substrate-binding protein
MAGFASIGAILMPGCEERTAATPLPPTEIVLIVKSRSDERSAAMIRAAEEEIKSDFRTVIRVVSEEATVDQEDGRFAPSVAIAAVLVSCDPWPGINPSIGTASGLNVPIFLLGELYGPQDKPYGWSPALVFTTLNDVAANQAGRTLFSHLEDRRLLEEASSVIVLRETEEDPAEQYRAKGFEQRLLLAPTKLRELETAFLSGGRDHIAQRVGQMLREHGNLRAILCTTSDLAVGAGDAVAGAGRQGQVLIAGADLSGTMVTAIRSGQVDVGVDHRPGKMAARAARFALNFDHARDLRRPGTPVLHQFEIVTKGSLPATPTTNEATAGHATTIPKG